MAYMLKGKATFGSCWAYSYSLYIIAFVHEIFEYLVNSECSTVTFHFYFIDNQI